MLVPLLGTKILRMPSGCKRCTRNLGRDVDEEGLTYWGGDLRGDAGRPIQTRTEVLANIMLSPEYSCHQKGGFYVHKTQMCVSKDSIYAELNKEVV